MSATPARDALGEATHAAALDMARGSGCCADESWRGHLCQFHQGFEDGMDTLLEAVDRAVVLAALVEAGPLTDDELRAARLVPVTLENTDWPIDMGTCPYNQRGKPGADPNGTCSFGCYDEPECQTCRPREGWPSDRGESPEPWRYAAEAGALDHPFGGDVTVWIAAPDTGGAPT